MRLTGEIYDSGLKREREREMRVVHLSQTDQSVRQTWDHCVLALCVKFMKGSTRQRRGQKIFCLSSRQGEVVE